MLVAIPVIAVGAFVGLLIRRLKSDLQQEKAFRAQLSGLHFKDNAVPLS